MSSASFVVGRGLGGAGGVLCLVVGAAGPRRSRASSTPAERELVGAGIVLCLILGLAKQCLHALMDLLPRNHEVLSEPPVWRLLWKLAAHEPRQNVVQRAADQAADDHHDQGRQQGCCQQPARVEPTVQQGEKKRKPA